MTEQQKQIIKALKNGELYDFISCNSYKLERCDIASVLLEAAYQLYKIIGEQQYDEAQKQIADALMELWG